MNRGHDIQSASVLRVTEYIHQENRYPSVHKSLSTLDFLRVLQWFWIQWTVTLSNTSIFCIFVFYLNLISAFNTVNSSLHLWRYCYLSKAGSPILCSVNITVTSGRKLRLSFLKLKIITIIINNNIWFGSKQHPQGPPLQICLPHISYIWSSAAWSPVNSSSLCVTKQGEHVEHKWEHYACW